MFIQINILNKLVSMSFLLCYCMFSLAVTHLFSASNFHTCDKGLRRCLSHGLWPVEKGARTHKFLIDVQSSTDWAEWMVLIMLCILSEG